MKTNKTDTIFRKFKDGQVIAIFPGIAGTNDYQKFCSSYCNTGQHSACFVGISQITKPILNESEYVNLKTELERIGYVVNVVKKFTTKHLKERKEQVESVLS